MFNELDNPLIYPKFSEANTPDGCSNFSIINPVQPLEFVLPENVISTLLASYGLIESVERVDDRSVKTLCQSPIYKIRNYDVNFAKYLSDALATYLPAQLTFNKYSRVDWQSDNPEGYNVWNLIGISPYFRFMEYTPGSYRKPHYSDSHRTSEDSLTRTLMTGIIYLTDNEDGATAFIDDDQHTISHSERKTEEWTTKANPSSIYEWSIPKRGNIIVFPHGDCRAVTQTSKTRKTLHFDIYYSAYGKK